MPIKVLFRTKRGGVIRILPPSPSIRKLEWELNVLVSCEFPEIRLTYGTRWLDDDVIEILPVGRIRFRLWPRPVD